MSASQEKKRRAEERASGTDKKAIEKAKAEKKAKRNKVVMTVVSVTVVLLIVAVIIFNSSLFYTGVSAVTIGDEHYTASEVNFFYYLSYYQMSSYASYMGLDTSTPLDEQEISDGETWADYFREEAVNTLTQITVLWKQAQEAGFELSEEDRTSLEEQLAGLETSATENGFSSVDDLLSTNYGRGVDYDIVSKLMERSFIADAFSADKKASYEYTDDELDAYYEEHADSYDNFTYLSYFASGAEDTANGIDSETAMATAKQTADDIMADSKAVATADGFKAQVLKVTGTEIKNTTTTGAKLDTTVSEWMLDDGRAEGDSTVLETDTGYYVVFFISRSDNDYYPVDVRHILIKVVADDTGAYTEEAKAEAKEKAESLLAEWKAGDATEDSFATLANENSEDTGSNTNGGLYEGVTMGQMVEQFSDWCFDPNRKSGDTGIVYNESDSYCGYHVMYFVGNEDVVNRLKVADTDKRGEDYDAWYEEVSANYAVDKSFTMSFVK